MRNNLKKIFIATVLLLALPSVALAQDTTKTQQVLDVNLHYNKGTVTLTSIDRREGYLPNYINKPRLGYKLAIFDKNNKEVFLTIFEFPLTVAGLKGPATVREEADITITTPVFEDAQKLVVYSPEGKTLVERNLYAPIAKESLTPAEKKKPASPNYLLIGAVAIVLLAAGSLLTFKVLKKRAAQAPPVNPPPAAPPPAA